MALSVSDIKRIARPWVFLGMLASVLFGAPSRAYAEALSLVDEEALGLAIMDNPMSHESWLLDQIMTLDRTSRSLEWVRAVLIYGDMVSASRFKLYKGKGLNIIETMREAEGLARAKRYHDEIFDLRYYRTFVEGKPETDQLYQDILAEIERFNLPKVKARYLSFYSYYLLNKGEGEKGIALMHEVSQLLASGLAFREAESINLKNYIGMSFYAIKQFDRAQAVFDDLMTQTAALKLRYYRSVLLHNLARTLLARDAKASSEVALGYLEEGLNLAKELHHEVDEGIFYGSLARAYLKRSQWHEALRYGEKMFALFSQRERSGELEVLEVDWLIHGLNLTTEAYIGLEDWDRALEKAQEALKRTPEDQKTLRLDIHAHLHRIFEMKNSYKEALLHFKKHSEISQLLSAEREEEILAKQSVSMGMRLIEEKNKAQAIELQSAQRLSAFKTALVSLLVITAVLSLAEFLRVRRKNKEIQALHTFIKTHILERFLPPGLVKDILEGAYSFDEAARKSDVTILFADLCSFTRATEHLGAEKIRTILNAYFAGMTEVIFLHGGTIDKFMGDGIMVIFGAPSPYSTEEQAQRAVQCARDMHWKLAELNHHWRHEYQWTFEMRIGIHQGLAISGSFGSDKRADYTVVGSAVNIASRIEHAARPDQILITDSVARHIDKVLFEGEGMRDLRGLDQPVPVYSVKTDEATRPLPHLDSVS